MERVTGMFRVEVSVGAEVAQRNPEVLVGAFLAEGVDRPAVAAAPVEGLVEDTRAALRAGGLTPETLAMNPCIADWRRAIRRSGLSASRWRGSAEQLVRRYLKGEAFSASHALVIAYCAFSARRVAPLGVYDLARLPEPRIELRAWRSGDRYDPIGATAEDFRFGGELIVYASGTELLSVGWNVRDSTRTCLTAGTSVALIVGEAVSRIQHDACRAALGDTAAWLATHGAKVGAIQLVDATHRTTIAELVRRP